MSRTVTVGIDGSRESLAAAEWAAREARLRGLPLRLVNVWEPVPEVMGRAPVLDTGTRQEGQHREDEEHEEHEEHGHGRIAPGETGAGKVLSEAADGVRARHPGVDVAVEQLTGRATEELVRTAEEAELLVLGSRGLSGIAGFLLGSVGLHVVAHTGRPVVLVRPGEQAGDENAPDPVGVPSAATPFRPVVLGLDTGHPDPTLIRFAFEAAALRETALRILHDWSPPPHSGLRARPGPDADPDADLRRMDAAALTDVLRPWRQEYPTVEVVEESRRGKAADHLLEASRDASLVVVGRRVRHAPLGAHIGPVAHAVLHHAGTPVAVVAHD